MTPFHQQTQSSFYAASGRPSQNIRASSRPPGKYRHRERNMELNGAIVHLQAIDVVIQR
jgi:hypothetical protein